MKADVAVDADAVGAEDVGHKTKDIGIQNGYVETPSSFSCPLLTRSTGSVI